MKIKKMGKVLIALDYDPTAQKVAEIGYSLANTMDAEVCLLHVILDQMYYSFTGHVTIMGFVGDQTAKVNTRTANEEKKTAQQFLDSSKKHLGDKMIQTIVVEGDIAKTILKTANTMHADLIVMGSHSKKWLENIVLGSVTHEVLNDTTIPVFIIPTKKHV
ncbi:MAG: universal stress protein [Bacteroidetes bacterium]|nr:universal stress protein [Bacteroidota bacterium]